jgi:hypothetical protein
MSVLGWRCLFFCASVRFLILVWAEVSGVFAILARMGFKFTQANAIIMGGYVKYLL